MPQTPISPEAASTMIHLLFFSAFYVMMLMLVLMWVASYANKQIARRYREGEDPQPVLIMFAQMIVIPIFLSMLLAIGCGLSSFTVVMSYGLFGLCAAFIFYGFCIKTHTGRWPKYRLQLKVT
jgi:hypothetical protein